MLAVRALVLLPLLGACDRVFALVAVGADARREDATLDSSIDAPLDAPAGTSCFFDDFDTTSIISPRWSVDQDQYATVKQSGGKLVFSLTPTSDVHYAVLATPTTDFTHDMLTLHVATVPDTAGHAEAGTSVQVDGQNRYLMMVTHGYLLMRTSQAGTNSDLSIMFNQVDHAYWRIRHTDADVFFDTSPDGGTWTNRRQMTVVPTVDITAVHVELFGGFYQLEPAATSAAFDDIRWDCSP